MRKLQEGHIKEVANIISTLGFSVPVLIGKNNTVLDGYGVAGRVEQLCMAITQSAIDSEPDPPFSIYNPHSASISSAFAGSSFTR